MFIYKNLVVYHSHSPNKSIRHFLFNSENVFIDPKLIFYDVVGLFPWNSSKTENHTNLFIQIEKRTPGGKKAKVFFERKPKKSLAIYLDPVKCSRFQFSSKYRCLEKVFSNSPQTEILSIHVTFGNRRFYFYSKSWTHYEENPVTSFLAYRLSNK